MYFTKHMYIYIDLVLTFTASSKGVQRYPHGVSEPGEEVEAKSHGSQHIERMSNDISKRPEQNQVTHETGAMNSRLIPNHYE